MAPAASYIGALALALALLGSSVLGKEINILGVAESEEYSSGSKHEQIMKLKLAAWNAETEFGRLNQDLYPELGYTKCVNGFAAAIPGDPLHTFRCNNVDLYHHLSHAALGAAPGSRGSSSWGWTSADGREFVALGHTDGTAFVEISKQGKLVYLGRLPSWDGPGAVWREIRVVGDLAVIGSEAYAHGVQLFDLKKLLDLDPANPKTFSQSDLAGHWGMDTKEDVGDEFWQRLPVGRTHNIVVNEELNYALAVGSVGGNLTHRVRVDMPCNGGLIFLNITDPANVHATGCAAADGYVHDAQCVVYRGPDKRYQGRDICYGYNEDSVTIYDVTNKIGNTTTIISRVSYEGAEYVHQGVVLDLNNQEYLVLDDEFDEQRRTGPASNGGFPTTHIFDIRDLENPKYTGYWQGKYRAIDHNQYIVDGLDYQSNYGAGLTVLDIRSIPKDPSGKSICEVGFFDVYPEDDELPGGGSDTFLGTWSSYPYFKSGWIFVHTMDRGSFVVKLTRKTCPAPPKCNADNCLRALRATSIAGRLEESQEFCHGYLARQRIEVSEITKDYATKACTRDVPGGVVAQVSSACACLPTATPSG